MSRVFGYSDSVYNIYNDLNNSKILKYKKDNNKTSWDDVINSIKEIDFYIPFEFKKNMKNNKIRVVRAPSLFNRNTIISTPTEENEDPTIIFPSRSAKEEYKKELVYFIGVLLREVNCDNMPDLYSIPSEYQDVLPLILEYLYLKNNNLENVFSHQKIHELYASSGLYVKAFNDYKKIQELCYNSRYLPRKNYEIISELEKDSLKKFEDVTLEYLIPLSSLDVSLQLIDNYNSIDFKKLIKDLYNNYDKDRKEYINDLGIDSYGFKRVKEEIEKYKVKSLKK
ncbi:MAG: hypothetical protein IJ568_05735 [Bacilli bacterium]|nr:hypothetical protein [Bacilli bacterium]